jgi:tetratricopeptide (TPR) repeat protein
VARPILNALFDRLPALRPGDDQEMWAAGVQEGMREFRTAVRARYTEGTLQRLVAFEDVRTRRAAVLALGLMGTMDSNPAVAAVLHDKDPLVQSFAADALWELWFRGGTAEQNRQLRRVTRTADAARARADLDDLIRQAPTYAEPYNQRAIWFFKRGEFARAVDDCEKALQLNPHHFGAAAGLGQCFVKLGRPQSALRAFKTALQINPALEHLRETIRSLEQKLGSGE